MKKILTGAGIVALMASTAMAQGVVRQVAVEGSTGNADYPVAVQGSNGIAYACEANLYLEDGVQKRLCVRADVPAGTTGSTLVAGDLGVVAAGVGALAVVALLAGDDDNSTTTSTP